MTRRFRFGLFTLDSERGELRRENALVRLQTQPAQVLACLVERAGQVVSREELRKAVWGDGTFVDFDAGLNFCISQIRSALRDDSAQPVYLRTIPKSGYQFIAPVELLPMETERIPQIAPAEELATVGSGDSHRIGAVDRKAAPPSERSASRSTTWWIVAGCVLVFAMVGGLVLLMVLYLTPGKVRSAANSPTTMLAVARFDNETGDAALNRFADGLTDNVVEQLTVRSGEKYRVIGNAEILRAPREQRDLRVIATSLDAQYVVLGQVQANGEQVRILAHLIRLADQTHIWVVRLERPRGDELKLEADAAAQIASEFAARMAQQPEKAPSFVPGSR